MSELTYSPGHYRGKIVKWGLSKTRNGNPQFVVTFQPLGMVDLQDPEGELLPCADFERSIFRVITEKTIDYVSRDLKNLGYHRDNFDGLDPNVRDAHNFMDLEIAVECNHETYEGKTREKWQFGGGGMEIVPLEGVEVKKLNALFGKKLKERAQPQQSQTAPAPARTSPPRQPAPTRNDAEEIPF